MILETAHLGSVEVQDTAMIHFVRGLPGFEDLTQFVMLELEEGLPYKWLQSVENADISLLVADPFVFYPEYDWQLAEQEQQELSIVDERQVEVWTVVTLAEDFHRSTVNLLAPIVLNKVDRLANQLILHDTGYQTKHPLIRVAAETADSTGRGE